jgi:membrane associated rhomboid family serine protease
MTPLTVNALQEPWTLWTCHLAHHDWQHAADNALALSIPLLLAQRKDRGRIFLWLLLLAPLLSLALLPSLHGETFGGLSGLGCATWTLVGLQLLFREETIPVGGLMLALLGLKFAVEGMTGSGLLAHHGRWQTLSASHLCGMLLGLGAGLLDETLRRFKRKVECCATRSLRRMVTVPR